MTNKSPVTEIRRPKGKKGMLLDTNVWRYVVDNNSQGALLRLARDGSCNVQIAPAVLYETLRLKDASLRANLVRLMTDSRFYRLMPEAYSESLEILQEIQRARPDWLRDKPDVPFLDRLMKDWTRKTGGFWVRCARSPTREAGFLYQAEEEMIRDTRLQAKRGRKEIIDSDWKRNPPMSKTLARFKKPVPGWRGDDVEAWRIDSWASLTFGLARQGNPWRDWIAPLVELDDGLLNSAAWLEFWLYLADKSAVPRQWMRWAYSFAQRFRTVTPGTPGDTQLSTYFLETDVVVTADKALIDILEECRPYAPCQLPEGKLISAGAAGVEDLLQMLGHT